MKSEAYRCYYGFMLGFIVNFLRFEFAEPRYKTHQFRIGEVISELGIALKLPEIHAAYRADAKIRQDLARELRDTGQTIVDFYAFGNSALQPMIDPESEEGQLARAEFPLPIK